MITTPEQWRSLCCLGIERWIDEKRAQGKIKQLGFSFHGKREDFTAVVDARDWDFTQIQYNYLDINNQAGRTGLMHAASKKMPVIVMEPLLGGRLADPKKIPTKILDIMKEAPSAKTPAALALRWIWNHPEVTLLLSGMSAQSQLDENISLAEEMAAPGILDGAELKTVDKVTAAYSEANRIKCTGCGYCVPCPFGVNIPDCFASYNTSYTLSKFAALRNYVMATAALTTKKGLASSCKQCGRCEEHCPQSIPIQELLKEVSRRLEPFWFRAGIAIVRFFTGVKAKKGR
jgi:predicted aldo/keto reductase-like oxidoreductase